MFCLRSVRCVQNSEKILDKQIVFTIGKLRNYVSLTATTYHRNSSLRRSNAIGKQHLSRYSSSTTMKHFKEFRMADYDIIGFDLDGTLLRYNINNMVPLEYELLIKFLVEEKNYPRALLERKFDVNFIQKGLIIDTLRGNILKLSGDGTIIKATHGTSFLNDNEIEEIYGADRKWNVALEYINDPLSAWNGPIADKLRTLLDYFDLPTSLVFAHAVDVLDATSMGKVVNSDYNIWPDLLAGLIQIYTREHFGVGKSAYFEALKASPEKYLLKTDERVINHLKELKTSGKALYLLTGSNIDFANFTATYALGPQWRDLFHYVISFGKKPGFFYMQRQFLQVKNLDEVPNSEIPLNNELTTNCYSQGNWQQLKESLSKRVLQKDSNRVRCLYVGDNLIQDVYAPNTVASMDCVAISEELLENDNNFDFQTIVQSSLWGSYFSHNGIPTLWSTIIEKYSQLCISHMDVLAKVPVKDKIYCENKEG